MLTDIFHLF